LEDAVTLLESGDASMLPAAPGAYVLDLVLGRRTTLAIASLGRPTLAPGRYLYVGSALGPGGIRARAGRHLRRRKTRRWHVDHLRARAALRGVVSLPGGGECEVIAALRAIRAVAVPVPGFGSSDCRRCLAHLLLARPDLDLGETLAAALPGLVEHRVRR
jgi:Uri superfamily endonuclease